MATDLTPGPVPLWEARWPGRFARELSDIDDARAARAVDEARLRQGALALDVWWPCARGVVHLRAMYPDSFPYMRPLVFLVDAPGYSPSRHLSPTDRQLCLLGRDSRQWPADWTLAMLLGRQLEAALTGSGDEDPQGEPAEVWWNAVVPPDATCYCLVDSGWSVPEGVGGGRLRVRYEIDKFRPTPVLRACVEEVVADGGAYRESMASPVFGLSRVMQVPWTHLDETLLPRPPMVGEQIGELVARYPRMRDARTLPLDDRNHGKLFAFSYPMETGVRRGGTGWLFFLYAGREAGRPGRPTRVHFLRTLRAGPDDLAARNPEAARLAGKRVAVVGVGAIGGPVAMELARNGCDELHLVDGDVVEPGNSIRWVAGQPAWGQPKAAAAKAFIERQWPSCRIEAYPHQVGCSERGDGAFFEEVLARCDLVVDATASYGVTLWLDAECRARGLPLVSAMATADLSGGVVAIFRPGGGCPRCLEHAWHRGDAPEFGKPGDDLVLQPPGCSERTFVGAGYDIQEIGLQTVRMALVALDDHPTSVVASMRFQEGTGGVRAASWRVDPLRDYAACGCRSRAS